jgi:hypothetical protein
MERAALNPKDGDLPEKFRNHPTMDYVNGEWRQNLSKLEEWYWQGLHDYPGQGAARVYLTFKCVTREDAQDLLNRLRSQPLDSLELEEQPSSNMPPVSPERIQAQVETLSRVLSDITGTPRRPDARIAILDSGPGWRVQLKSQVIKERPQLTRLFDCVRALLSESRWSLEGSGVGP